MSFLKYLLPAWKQDLTDKSKTNEAILNAIDTELTDSEQDLLESKVLLSLDTTTGIWLDDFGTIFGIIRQDSETDSAYRSRIETFITLERGTIPAIKSAVQAFLNDYTSGITVYEPYTNIFMLNSSHLNGADHFQGLYYTTAVIDIQINRSFPSNLLDVIKEYTPAGVTVHITQTNIAMDVTNPLDATLIVDPSTLIDTNQSIFNIKNTFFNNVFPEDKNT